jgi:hypothetical protein
MPSHGGNTGSNPVGDASNYKALDRTALGYPKKFPTLCSWTRLDIGRWSTPRPRDILRSCEARCARSRVSSRDENPTQEHLICGVYTRAEWDTIRNFANTSDGKSYLLRRQGLAFTKLRLASRGLQPEDAKVWTARPPSEEAKRWDEIAGAGAHLCSLLDAERTKWAPLVGAT